MRSISSVFRTLAIATILYACTEDSETKSVESATAPDVNGKGSKKGSTSARVSVWNTEVGASIDYHLAKSWIENHKRKNPGAPLSRFYGKNSFDRIFRNPAAVGISIVYALDDNGVPLLLLVGVDANGKILAQPSSASLVAGTSISSYEDETLSCPLLCPTDPDEN
jgi:hypothetical protein